MNLPDTGAYAGSIPYDATDEEEIILYPEYGKHERMDLERSIYWLHQNIERAYFRPVKVHWVNQKTNEENEEQGGTA